MAIANCGFDSAFFVEKYLDECSVAICSVDDDHFLCRQGLAGEK